MLPIADGGCICRTEDRAAIASIPKTGKFTLLRMVEPDKPEQPAQ